MVEIQLATEYQIDPDNCGYLVTGLPKRSISLTFLLSKEYTQTTKAGIIVHSGTLDEEDEDSPARWKYSPRIFFGKGGYFCAIRIGKEYHRTKEIKPKLGEVFWNETLNYKITNSEEECFIYLYKGDIFDKLIGSAQLNLPKILQAPVKIQHLWFCLTTRQKRDKSRGSLSKSEEELIPSDKSEKSEKSEKETKKGVIRKSTLNLLSKFSPTERVPALTLDVECRSRQEELETYFSLKEPVLGVFDCFCSNASAIGGEFEASSEKLGRLYLLEDYLCFYANRLNLFKLKISKEVFVLETKKSKGALYVMTKEVVLVFYGFSKHFAEVRELISRSELDYSLHQAIAHSNEGKVHFLFEHVDVIHDINQLDEAGRYPIHAAFAAGNTPIILEFLNYYEAHKLDINVRDRYGLTPLHTAFYYCLDGAHDDSVSQLLNFGSIDVEAETQDKATPIHIFMQHTQTTDSVELAELLFARGASKINSKNNGGETPLHYAVLNRYVRVLMIDICLKHGADVNVQSTFSGETPLHYAARLNRADCIDLLLSHGADPEIQSKENATAMDLARESEDSFESCEILTKYSNLKSALQELDLSDYYLAFIENELFLDDLRDLDDEFLKSTLGIVGIPNVDSKLMKKLRIKAQGGTLFDSIPLGSSGSTPNQSWLKIQDNRTSLLILTNPSDLENDLKQMNSHDWQIKYEELEYTKEIGSGASGKVFQGIYNGKQVAIKALKSYDKNDTQVLEDFKKEFQMLSIIRHENVIHFYGASLYPRVCMVMEICQEGSLYRVLQESEIKLDYGLASSFCFHLCCALAEVHRLQVYHRDVKCQNILVDRSLTCKLADFGEAIFFKDSEEVVGMAGTIGWSAPELFQGEPFTTKADVYSLGVTLWEMFNTIAQGKYSSPYKEYSEIKMPVQILTAASEQKLRPTLVDAIPEKYRRFISSCWDHNPQERPNADTLVSLARTNLEKTNVCALRSPATPKGLSIPRRPIEQK